MIRYKVYSEQHPRADLNIRHEIYKQLARAGRNITWIRYSLCNWILQPWIITFLLLLLFDLGYRRFLFASTMNLKARPRHAKICYLSYDKDAFFKNGRKKISYPKNLVLQGTRAATPSCIRYLFIMDNTCNIWAAIRGSLG